MRGVCIFTAKLQKEPHITIENDLMMSKSTNQPQETKLYNDVREIIERTRTRLAVQINSEVIWLNWQVGKRIREDVLYSERAEYGKETLKNLSTRLVIQFGKGWGFQKLQHCVRAAYTINMDAFTVINEH